MQSLIPSSIFGLEVARQTRQTLVRQVYAPVMTHCCLEADSPSLPCNISQIISQQINKTISSSSPIQSLVLMIDIVCAFEITHPEMASQMAQDIFLLVDQEYPDLRDRFVGISNDQQCLPLRHIILTRSLAFGKIDNQNLFIFE